MSFQSTFFGPDNSLYGVVHEPAPASTRAPTLGAVLICPPIGFEYIRSHTALRQLAVELAAQGAYVLRFDYSGTGDSAGDCEQARWQDWIADVRTASQELSDRSGVKEISVLGLRLGATVACAALADKPLEHLYLWHPVISGTDFLRDLDVHHSYLREKITIDPSGGQAEPREELRDAEHVEKAGYVFSRQLLHDIAMQELGDYPLRHKRKITLSVSKSLGVHNRLISRWNVAGARTVLSEREDLSMWTSKPTFDQSDVPWLPMDVIGNVVTEIGSAYAT